MYEWMDGWINEWMCECMNELLNAGGQDSLVDQVLDYRPLGTGFDPRFDQ
jgi:hypothetical protein